MRVNQAINFVRLNQRSQELRCKERTKEKREHRRKRSNRRKKREVQGNTIHSTMIRNKKSRKYHRKGQDIKIKTESKSKETTGQEGKILEI
jgi:hypothetical protein